MTGHDSQLFRPDVLWIGPISINKRDGALPEWEPIPWNAVGPQVDEQEKGFHQRALKPLVWTKVDWNEFPEDGIFGRDRDWFVDNDISYATTFDDEDLILIQNTYFGFPDPPEWGLASRPTGNAEARWEWWGLFPDLPAAWVVPEVI
ncbi:hypothetical protein I41_11850 [Lacipirellula limnantheis]|uniref:Uncharacterized protein n=1 Tax=Lacipirellula limnantheis TaxID=2528024 RepID=A0A517TUG9_9BACT|nr:hypothetical protein I41_11850 [Lacipirellula limnantheis]